MDDFFNKPNQNGEDDSVQPEKVAPQQFEKPIDNVNQYYNPVEQPVAKTEEPIVNPVEPPVQRVQEPQGIQTPYYYSAPVQNQYTNTEPKKPKKKSKALIVIIAIIVCCIVVSVVGLALYSGGSSIGSGSGDGETTTSNTDDSGEGGASLSNSQQAATTDADGNLTAAGIAAQCSDSCVGITVYTKQDAYSYFYNYGYGSNSSGDIVSGEGSGVIMSESNGKTYILTCAHVIADGSSFEISLNDKTTYDATMVGYDSKTDIGVLSIEATGLSVAEFGDSESVVVGEDVVAIGCPGGLDFQNSVTKGIVSGLQVPVSSSIGYNNECIQTDTAINPGNSGGALFNMQGQVIGINSSKIASTEYEGMGFAVPSKTAIETANSLIKNGYVAGRAKLGITYVSLENFNNASTVLAALEKEGYKGANGTMVIQEVESESSLYGKVQEYDMIVAVNGETMTSTDVMTSVLSDSKPGDTITLTIARIENNKITTFETKCKLIESKE